MENWHCTTMKKIQNTIQNISIDNNFSPNGFWELCRNIRKKSGTIGTSIITESGNEVFGDELIADAYVKEFKQCRNKQGANVFKLALSKFA